MYRRIHQFARSTSFSGLLPVLLVGLLLGGCGKKTFPRPVSQTVQPQIQDLKAEVAARGVELNWSIPQAPEGSLKRPSHRYMVLKSEVAWDKRSCLDCPAPDHEAVATIDPASGESALVADQRIAWVDTDVAHERAYRYQIGIVDRKGRFVSLSNPAIAVVLAVPPAPGELSAVEEAQGVLLQWKAPQKDTRGRSFEEQLQFVVERRSPDGAWEKISPSPVKGNRYFDAAVAADRVYDYRVLSLLVFEETKIWSEPSEIRQVRTPDALPPPPPGTVWVIPAKGSLEVHWTESEGNVGGYHVYRRESKEIIRLTSSPVRRPPYIDASIKRNTVYFYAVSAVDSKPDQREGLLSKWAEIRSVLFE